MEFSLDEYINRKNAADTVSLLNIRKKDKVGIDQEKLDSEIEEYMHNVKSGDNNSGPTKFNRIKFMDSDEDMPTQKSADDCCKPFPMTERNYNGQNKSQQWRLGNNGNQKNFRNGRVGKNYRQNSGSYIEQGNFTFKYQGGNDTEVSGIVRNQKNRRVYHHNGNRRENEPIVLNINASDLQFAIPQPFVQQFVPKQGFDKNQEINDLFNLLKGRQTGEESGDFVLEYTP